MKIASVQSYLLSCPFAEPIRLPFWGGERTILKRDAMFIRVTADNGLVGYAPGAADVRAQQAIQDVIGPFLTDRTLSDPDALRVIFMEGPGVNPALARVYCCFEIALYDLASQALGVPLSEMLGGRVRDRIRLYGSAGMYMEPEGYAAEAAAIKEMGFRAYKMRPALGPERDLETIRLMRQSVGNGFDLMVDAHTWWRMGDRSYNQETVSDLAGEFGALDVAWLEEPLPPHDHAAYARLRDRDLVPLASGEHEPSEERYLDLISTESVDYVQMDVCCQGGYAVGRRVMAEVSRHTLRFAFHSWGTALEVAAAAHLGICWPEYIVEYLEYPCYSAQGRAGMYPFPLANEILTEPLAIDRGYLEVPRRPGLGVKVDESVVDRYPWIPGPWSYFRIDSPPETLAVVSDHSIPWDGKQSI